MIPVMKTCLWLPSGNRLDTAAPRPEAWTDGDLAAMMAAATMWGGASRWEHPLSLAQHSIGVLALRELQEGGPLPPHKALRELLHDAAKGLLGLCHAPAVQAMLGTALRDVAEAVHRCVQERYGLPGWQIDEMRRRSSAETFVTANEAFYVLGMPKELVTREYFSFPLEVDPIARMAQGLPAGMEQWQPWPREIAQGVMLQMLSRLQVEAGESYSKVPAGKVFRARDERTGATLPDTAVRVTGRDGCTSYEGVIVRGKRDENGWDLDGTFVILTDDCVPGELISVNGWICDVELL